MGQLLRLAILLFGLWVVLQVIRKALSRHKSDQSPLPPPSDMLRCDYCGIFVPHADAIQARDKHYCCADHAKKDQAGEPK